jgi:hypothetical protein
MRSCLSRDLTGQTIFVLVDETVLRPPRGVLRGGGSNRSWGISPHRIIMRIDFFLEILFNPATGWFSFSQIGESLSKAKRKIYKNQ